MADNRLKYCKKLHLTLYFCKNASSDRKQFADYITLVQDKVKIEKYIATMTNNRTSFVKKWSSFLSLI